MKHFFSKPLHSNFPEKANLSFIFSGFLLLTACDGGGEKVEKPFEESDYPKLTDQTLIKGREIWVADCQTCHLPGKQGAPKIGSSDAWSSRFAKGEDELFKNAIEGYDSPAGYEMPARGGNDELSDEDVIAAVKYMLHRSK